jgi:dTMP kinase
MSRTPRHLGTFVTFEGVEGAGKTTQIARLARHLRAHRLRVVVTREPGGTPLGAALRRVLLRAGGPAAVPRVEILLYAADRTQHLVDVVLPALRRGAVVLCDRYLDATLAYQGYGRGRGTAEILALHADPPLDLRPDRTVLLDHDPRAALARARRRDRQGSGPGNRMEREDLAFHRRVRRGYLTLARLEPGRIRVVDARGTPEAVAARVREALADLIPAPGGGARRT